VIKVSVATAGRALLQLSRQRSGLERIVAQGGPSRRFAGGSSDASPRSRGIAEHSPRAFADNAIARKLFVNIVAAPSSWLKRSVALFSNEEFGAIVRRLHARRKIP
jgi:hypothetical protein